MHIFIKGMNENMHEIMYIMRHGRWAGNVWQVTERRKTVVFIKG